MLFVTPRRLPSNRRPSNGAFRSAIRDLLLWDEVHGEISTARKALACPLIRTIGLATSTVPGHSVVYPVYAEAMTPVCGQGFEDDIEIVFTCRSLHGVPRGVPTRTLRGGERSCYDIDSTELRMPGLWRRDSARPRYGCLPLHSFRPVEGICGTVGHLGSP